MSGFEGFFKLRTPADLLEKLKYDCSRIERDSRDVYAAFDFFVTAEHLLDWKYPDVGGDANTRARTDLRKNESLLRVTSHLANGAKHFKTTASRHTSVDDAYMHKADFDPADFDPADFDTTDRLVVDLAGDDAMVLGPEISVLDLARRVLDYWEDNLGASEQA